VIRAAAFLARRDLRHVLRGRETLLWTFVMPPVFFFFIGTITGGFGDSAGPEPLVLEAPADAGHLAGAVERRLEERGFDVRRVAAGAGADVAGDDDPADGAATGEAVRLVIPAGFTDSLLAGSRVRVLLDPGSDDVAAARYVEVRASRAVYGVLADLAAIAAAGDSVTPASLRAIAAEPRLLTLDVRDAGNRVEPPTGFEQAVPGTMVMFTLLVLLTSGAAPLVMERQTGLLRRLASAPISRGAVVAGKAGARLGLALVQIAFAALTGTLLFGVGWGPDPAMVALVLVAWAALAALLGLLLGNLARSPGQAVALGVLAGNLLAALGGCWWPIEITPPWMQGLARILPTGVTMDALHRLVSFEAGASSALPHVLALVAMSAVAGWLAARTFRFA
jgi:ABC-type Na+ efflux pump permease subunit